MRALNDADRIRIRVFAIVGVLVFGTAAAVRFSLPAPIAPRVHVRWSTEVDNAQRAALERRLSLEQGEEREDNTWEYDLTDISPASVRAVIERPEIADTHYIDRSRGTVSPDAPVGTVRLDGRPLAAVAHSLFFDWLLLFSASSVVVSGTWLASTPNTRG